MPSNRSRFWLSFLALLAAAAPVRAEKLFDFSFDGSGPIQTSSRGAKSAVALQMRTGDGTKADVRGPAGSGVSGKPGDRAFDGTSANDMGSMGSYGPVAVTAPVNELASLASYTIQGWFKTDDVLPNSVARLVVCSLPDNKHPMLDLMSTVTAGDFLFAAYNPTRDEAPTIARLSNRTLAREKKWTFFAVVYDGTTLKFFSGRTDTPVAEVSSTNYPTGATGALGATIAIGNHTKGKRPFDGWLDNIRIFGSAKDAKGALTLPELEALRLEDVKGP